MDQETIIASIEERAFRAGVSIDALCRRAGVHPTTFSRWKRSERNPDPLTPTFRTIRKLYDALAVIEAKGRRRSRRSAA